MWYGREHESGKTTGLQIGPVSFTLQTIWVSIASLLTVLPVAITLVYLFNHCELKNNKQSDSTVSETSIKEFTDKNEMVIISKSVRQYKFTYLQFTNIYIFVSGPES